MYVGIKVIPFSTESDEDGNGQEGPYDEILRICRIKMWLV